MTLKELRKFFDNRIRIEGKHCCWIWIRCYNNKGYGKIGYKGKLWYAHRLSFFLLNGWVPPELDHIVCDTPGCCHPNHVVPATRKENISRSLKLKEVLRNKTPEWKAKVRKANQNKSPEWKANLRDSLRKVKAKLTLKQVHQIRKEYRAGALGVNALGRKYGVHHMTISKIVHRMTWREI